MTIIQTRGNYPVRKFSSMPIISELFNDFFDNMVGDGMRRTNVPSVNIVETDDVFRIEMAAPGLKKEDFRINVEDDLITISGESKTESKDKEERWTRREFSYTSFQRSFNLPDFIEIDKISASYEDGLMKVTLPKRETAKTKQPKEIRVS